jgi:acetaldehyde dehydrogenase/alcohol dehydrogenase
VSEEAFLAAVDRMAEQAFDDQCTGTNPRAPLIDDLKRLYLAAYYGKVEHF